MTKERCPHVIRKRAGDETYYICKLDGRLCSKEYTGNECDNEWREDEEKEMSI